MLVYHVHVVAHPLNNHGVRYGKVSFSQRVMLLTSVELPLIQRELRERAWKWTALQWHWRLVVSLWRLNFNYDENSCSYEPLLFVVVGTFMTSQNVVVITTKSWVYHCILYNAVEIYIYMGHTFLMIVGSRESLLCVLILWRVLAHVWLLYTMQYRSYNVCIQQSFCPNGLYTSRSPACPVIGRYWQRPSLQGHITSCTYRNDARFTCDRPTSLLSISHENEISFCLTDAACSQH